MKLDLGCGPFKADGYTGIDSYDYSKKYDDFIQGTVPEVFKRFADGSIEKVRASHFLEHVPQSKVIHTMNEIYRILIPGGEFEIYVPPTPGRGAWCDPCHVSFWNDLSFRYYDMSWCRQLSESYGIKCNFKQVKVKTLNETNLYALLKKV